MSVFYYYLVLFCTKFENFKVVSEIINPNDNTLKVINNDDY